MIDDTGGEDDGARGFDTAIGCDMEQVPLLFNRTDCPGFEPGTIELRMRAHPVKKITPGNAVWKGRKIVRFRNHPGPPFLSVINRNAPQEPGKIKPSGQSRRAATDDDAVFHVRFSI